ncbi:glycosyltransferase, partial [Staphylococcus succinus]
MFSVILPVYNAENSIKNTIQNIIREFIFEEDELIIVNDGSTDGTEEVLSEYIYAKQVKIINKINEGVSTARNVGMANTSESSKYITFVDDSDTLSNGYFQKCYEFFNKHKHIKLAVSPIIISENGLY